MSLIGFSRTDSCACERPSAAVRSSAIAGSIPSSRTAASDHSRLHESVREKPIKPVEVLQLPGEISLYIHLPFCTRKCGYCHFYVVADRTVLKDQLLKGLSEERTRLGPLLAETTLASIYFGGGTPALFGPDRIKHVLGWFKGSDGIEVTLEVNPEEATLELLEAYAEVGINRLSVGVQSFNDTLLKRLTRLHSADKARQTLANAQRAGFRNVSIDLMYDIPGQTLGNWRETLDECTQLPIQHISLYNLTIEPQTPFYTKRQELLKICPPGDVSRQMYEEACQTFEAAEIKQYEISAFARQDFFSRHNTGYWTARPFLGLGPSAFSYWEGKRYRNIPHLENYCRALEKNLSPIDFEERLSPEASRREHLVLQLRLCKGIDLPTFEQQFGHLEVETIEALKTLEQQAFIHHAGQHVTLTKEGRLFYDTVASLLI